MKVAITQPNYIPWIGYFDLLNKVDLFIAFDNVQFVKRSFIGRNRVKSPNETPTWLTVNLDSCKREDKINEVYLKDNDWHQSHLQKLKAYYAKAKYFDLYFGFFSELLKPLKSDDSLATYNVRLLKAIAIELGIKTKIVRSSNYIEELSGSAEDKILSLCNKIDVSAYYNFQKGVEEGLYKPENFTKVGIKLFKQKYIHPQYSQTGNTFLPYLSIIDLMFNEGEKSLEIINSGSNWEKLN